MPEPGPSATPAVDDAARVDADRDASAASSGAAANATPATDAKSNPQRSREIGGREGPDPTRYGDWEYKGRCIDF